MVVLGVVSLIERLFSLVLGVLPSFTPPDLVAGASAFVGSTAFSYLGWANDYLPITELAYATSAIAGVFGVIWIVKLVVWLLSKFHIMGGS